MLRTFGTRPPTVWLAQLLLFGGAFVLLVWPLKVFLTCPETGAFMLGDYVGPDQILTWSLKFLAFLSPFIVVPLIALVGLARGERYGRWLSLLVFFGAFLCSALLFLLSAEGHRFKTGPVVILRMVVFFLLAGTCVLLIARLGFGEPEKKFFNS